MVSSIPTVLLSGGEWRGHLPAPNAQGRKYQYESAALAQFESRMGLMSSDGSGMFEPEPGADHQSQRVLEVAQPVG